MIGSKIYAIMKAIKNGTTSATRLVKANADARIKIPQKSSFDKFILALFAKLCPLPMGCHSRAGGNPGNQ
jgi:hypothetical protein